MMICLCWILAHSLIHHTSHPPYISHRSLPSQVQLFTRICAALFGVTIIGSGVPVFCVMIRTAIYHTNAVPYSWSLFLWVVVICGKVRVLFCSVIVCWAVALRCPIYVCDLLAMRIGAVWHSFHARFSFLFYQLHTVARLRRSSSRGLCTRARFCWALSTGPVWLLTDSSRSYCPCI